MNEKILIVGGSSGLGKKLAELYAADGAQVGVIARRANLLEALRAAILSIFRSRRPTSIRMILKSSWEI